MAFSVGIIVGRIIGGFLSSQNIVSWLGLPTPFFATTILSIGTV